MPTTSYTDTTFAVSAIGSRTDGDGVAVTDIAAEEIRLPNVLLSEGYVTPSAAFKVQAQVSPAMSVRVGSQTAKADHYVIRGEGAGQGNYIVRQDVTSTTVTIAAADASQARVDEIYLVVQDSAYDGSSRGLPRIGYRKGDLGGGVPGADSAWTASVALARIAVAAGATTITSGNITDLRSPGGLIPQLATDNTPDDDTPTTIPGLDTLPRVFALTAGKSAGSTTMVTGFSVPITQTGRYLVEGLLRYSADPARGMRLGLTIPSGATGRWTAGGMTFSNASRIGPIDSGTVPLGTTMDVTGDSLGPTVELSCRPLVWINCPTAGTLVLKFSQVVSGGNFTFLDVGSTLRVTRVSS